MTVSRHNATCDHCGRSYSGPELADRALVARIRRREPCTIAAGPDDCAGHCEVNILSIDAWRDDSGWTWNNWFKVGTIRVADIPAKPRGIFHYMREHGYLSPVSRGRVSLEDDGYNAVICARGTGEPVYAIAYGEAF